MTGMDCKQARHLLHLRFDRDLSQEHSARLDEHIAGCGQCARLSAELQAVEQQLRAGLLAASPRPGLDRHIAGSVIDAPVKRPSWVTVTAIGAITVIAILALTNLTQRGHHHSSPWVVGGPRTVSIHVLPPGAVASHAAQPGAPVLPQSVLWGTEETWTSVAFPGGARVQLDGHAVAQIGANAISLYKGCVHVDLRDVEAVFTVASPWGAVTTCDGAFSLSITAEATTAALQVTRGDVCVRMDGDETRVRAGESVDLGSPAMRALAL